MTVIIENGGQHNIPNIPNQNIPNQPDGGANIIQQPVQADPNAAALAHLSDTDRAAAEMFLRGASVQEAAKHTKWSLATKIITGIFTFGIAPAIMCRKEAAKEKQLAADAVNLKNAMNSMAVHKQGVVRNVLIDGRYISIASDKNGTLSTTIGGQTIVSRYTPKVLAEIIEDDIIANTDLYGTEAALDILNGAAEAYRGPVQAPGHAGRSLAEQHIEEMAPFFSKYLNILLFITTDCQLDIGNI